MDWLSSRWNMEFDGKRTRQRFLEMRKPALFPGNNPTYVYVVFPWVLCDFIFECLRSNKYRGTG